MARIKRSLMILITLIWICMPLQAVHADTLEDYLNNLIGPRQQYNTLMSPVYLRNNTLEEYISPQSGELTINQVDFSLPGRNGLDLEIKRIYNSSQSNWYEMKAKYSNGVWVDYVNNDISTTSFIEDRYNLGIAMRFSFPTMEIKANSDGTSYKYLYTDTGDTYRLSDPIIVNGVNTYELENHTIKDIEVREDSNYTNNQTDGTSKYVMLEKNGKKTYFADDGRILGIVDRYGNTIKFEYATVTYAVDGTTKTKRLISKITDTVGRIVNIEYLEDSSFVPSKNADGTYSSDLQGKFRVVVYLPDSTPAALTDNKKIIYDKTGVLISSTTGHVLRTRIQRIYDLDSAIKYQYWYEPIDLGFSFTSKTAYSVMNRYDNLVQIDYYKTNKLKRYVYGKYTKNLSDEGRMEYRKVTQSLDLIKTGWDDTKTNYLDKFICTEKNKVTYAYEKEPDGYGETGYDANNENYLKATYRYHSTKTDKLGTVNKYTYSGKHELLTIEDTGSGHKEITANTYDGNKMPSKKETIKYNTANQALSVKKIENFVYDQYGNLVQYTDPLAARDADGNPTDSEHTVFYAYATDRYHTPLSKAWKNGPYINCRTEYTVDSIGNITQEKKVHFENGQDKSVITEYQYGSYGNMTKKTVNSADNTYIYNYEYGTDIYGTSYQGAYITKEYMQLGTEVYEKKYVYNFYTGDKKEEFDERGNKTKYDYDLPGRVTKITYEDNITTKQYTYNDNWLKDREVVYTDRNGNKFSYFYDIVGDMVKYSVMDQDGQWQTIKSVEYDANRNKTKETNANGHSIVFTYDSANRLTKKAYFEKGIATEKESILLKYEIAKDANIPLLLTVTDEEVYNTRYIFDILNRLVKAEVTPDKTTYYTKTYEYDYTGNTTRITDAKGNTAVDAYDDLGRLISRRDPLNNELIYQYNGLDKLLLEEQPGGKMVKYIYNTIGRLSEKQTYQKGSTTYYYEAYTYDPAGNTKTVEQGKTVGTVRTSSSFVEYQYNSRNLLSDEYRKIDALRKTHIKYSYDGNGNKTQITEYAVTNETEGQTKYIRYNYHYDFADKPDLEEGYVQDTDGQKGYSKKLYTRDYDSNLKEEKLYLGKDSAGNPIYSTITYQYDHRNRIKQKTEPFSSTGFNKTTTYAYDRKGNLTTETVAKQGGDCVKTYEYDGMGNVTKYKDPLAKVNRYVYDINGNKIKEIDGRYYTTALESLIGTLPRIEYEYDASNRLIRATAFENGKTYVVSYVEYDGRGNITKKVNGEGYANDSPSSSIGDTYAYDVNDKVLTFTGAATMRYNQENGQNKCTAKYTYDGSGNVTKEEDAYGNTTQFLYYLNGKLKEKIYADNIGEKYDYDLTGKLQMTKTNKKNAVTTEYYNVFGKRYKIVYPDTSFETFDYTSTGFVSKSVDREGNIKSFSYDPNGSLISEESIYKEDSTYRYYRVNRYTYDQMNNRLSSETFTLNESKANGARSPEVSTGNKVTYAYDAYGRLKTISGPNGRETVNDYDAKGNLTLKKEKVSDANYNINRYEYDVRSNLTAKILLVKDTDISLADRAGAQYDTEYPGMLKAKEVYAYDNSGRLKLRTDARGNATGYAYDDSGKPTKVTDPYGYTIQYVYDLNGNLIEEKNAARISTYYEYDNLNRLNRKKAPAADGSMAVTRYLYDAMGNKTKEIQPNQYEAAKDTQELAIGMVGLSYEYDSMNRLKKTLSTDNKVIQCIKYDRNGNVKKAVEGPSFNGDIETSTGKIFGYDGDNRVITITDALNRVTTYEYDALGNLVSQKDARGNVTLYEYNTDKTLKRVTYPDGGYVQYTYDKLGNLMSQIDQRLNSTTFEYNAFGKLRKVTDARTKTIEYVYDLNGNLTSEKNRRGHYTYYAYDKLNRLIEKKGSMEDMGGTILYAIESYLYDEAGNVSRKTLTGTKDTASKRETVYTYYPNNLLDTVADSNGSYTKYSYDTSGNRVKAVVLRDNGIYDISKYIYDAENRLVKEIKLVDEKDLYEGITTKLPNFGNLRDAEYPGKIQLITGYAYDVMGNRTKVMDPRAYGYLESDSAKRAEYTTEFVYDKLNRVETVKRVHAGQTVTAVYTYDEVGNKLSEKNERSFTTEYTYDSMNRFKTSKDPYGSTMTYEYDKAGNLTSQKNAKGDSISFTYDNLNRQELVKDAYGAVISKKEYDANGNVTKEMDAKGYLQGYGTIYEYDLANRLVRVLDPETAKLGKPHTYKYKYNQYGERIEEIDAKNRVTKYEYDNAGQLIKVTDAKDIATEYTRDKAGMKTSAKDGKGNVTYYSYGSFGILRSTTNAEGLTMTYAYDLALNNACVVDRNGNHTEYAYNNRNQITKREVTETADSISYAYDEAGNRIGMTDETGTTAYTYDKNNRLDTVQKGGITELDYEYDSVGNVASVTDFKGNTTSYSYDKSNRMEIVSFTVGSNTRSTTYSYDENGNRKSVMYHSGIKEEYTYDANNRLLVLTNTKPDGSEISHYSYTYDVDGRQTSKTDNYGTTTYGYDDAGRITSVEAPGKTMEYLYDDAGNREALNETYNGERFGEYIDPVNGKAVEYKVKKSQYVYTKSNVLLMLVEQYCDGDSKVLFTKTVNYRYDKNGNEIQSVSEYAKPKTETLVEAFKGMVFGKDTAVFAKIIEETDSTYDGFNRLKKVESIKDGARTSVEYSYNGDDLRTKKVVKRSANNYAAEETNYLYDRQHVILETDGNGSVKVKYARGINYIARVDGSNKLSYFLYNGHGDVVQTVAPTGTLENSYDYDVFGNPTLTIEKYSCSIRYAGEFLDIETGLYYLRARYYDPYIGRFISEDSYWGEDANPLSLNLYTYAHNDPIKFVDPTGHSVEENPDGGSNWDDYNDWLDDFLNGDDDDDDDDDRDRVEIIVYPDKIAVYDPATKDDDKDIIYVIESSGSQEDDLAMIQEYLKESGYENTDIAEIGEAKVITWELDDGDNGISSNESKSKDPNLITIGDSGDKVEEVQRLLIGAKITQVNIDGKTYDVKADGDFGKITLAAIKAYQEKVGLKVDGIVGQKTMAALYASNNLGEYIPDYKSSGRYTTDPQPSLQAINMDSYIEGAGKSGTANPDPLIKAIIKTVAKDVAKPIVVDVKNTISKINVTETVGVNVAGSPSIWQLAGSIQVSADTKGNIAVQMTGVGGPTGGTKGASATVFHTTTNAPTVMHLEGEGYQIGVSGGAPIGLIPASGGLEVNIIPSDAEGKTYYGLTESAGLGTPGAEFHVEWGETKTIYKTNVFDSMKKIYNNIMEW